MSTLRKTTRANHLQQKINPPTTKLLESKGRDRDNTRNHSTNYDMLVKYTTRRILMPRKLTKLPPSASTTSSESCQGSFTTKKRSIKTPIWRPNTKETKQVSKVKTRMFAGYSLTLLPPNSLKQKTVVLDLDETLIHSTSYLPPDIPPRRNYDFRLMLRGRRVRCVKKRPFVDKFLEYLSLNNFEVVIFTAGTRGYASPVLDKLDPKGLISHRLYRDSCNVFNGEYYVKDLSRLGRDLNNVVIVDDRPTSYKLQPENGILIKPFIYDLKDDELKKLMDNFFNTCNNYIDLKDAVKNYRDRHFMK